MIELDWWIVCVHEIAFPDLLKNYSKKQVAFTNTSLDSSRRMSKIKDCHYNKQVQKSSQHGHASKGKMLKSSY